MNAPLGYPERIVCLTEETVETLYLLEEDWRIVGISGFTVRPPRARLEKPKVSLFTSADVGGILALRPDLVLGFSDLQADIARDLVRAGIEVHVFNHRSVSEILRTVRVVGGLVGAEARAQALAERLATRLDTIAAESALAPVRPTVYFEEWGDPLITGIRWVAELVRLAGGDDLYPELSRAPLARDRIVADPLDVARRAPDIIIGSWCGKRFQRDRVAARAGWQDVPAVRDGELHEVKSSIILQPGPAALTDGVDALRRIVRAWQRRFESGATTRRA